MGCSRGEHREIKATFRVPDTGGQNLQMLLRTFKRGALTFEETRQFQVGKAAGNATDEVQITFE